MKYSVLILLCLIATGCPAPVWVVESDTVVRPLITEECINTLIDHEGVRSVEKIVFGSHITDYDRYRVETNLGDVDIDILKTNNIPQRVNLRLSGPGIEVPDYATSQGPPMLKRLAGYLNDCESRNKATYP